MVNQLSGLLSDKGKKPIIINGRLAMDGNAVLMLKREKYRVNVIKVLPGRQEVLLDEGDDVLSNLAEAFNKKYMGALGMSDTEELKQHYANVDPFTGAVVLKNELYNQLLDKGNKRHFHDGTIQFKAQLQDTLDEFTKEFVMNYFEIYSYLLNRRLMASHMPVKIKGHLVAGLYQPIIVGTRHIDCPLSLGEFSWFLDAINNPTPCEERLESEFETTRGLELTAISMYDFSKKFNTPCLKNLNRLYFQFILYTNLLNILKDGNASEMVNRFKRIYQSMRTGRGDTAGVLEFLAACIEGFKHYRSTLVVY